MESRADKMLAAAGASVGDRLRVDQDGRQFEGLLMPRHAASQPDIVILKLSSGYNVGIRLGDNARIAAVTQARAKTNIPRAIPSAGTKPTVAVLGTGGTIASFVDYRTGAVHPAATAEELAFATPELFEIANIQAEVVYQVFSEDLEPKNWTELATKVCDAFARGARGVIIPHGTDTLHFTAAALSFALQDLPGPVLLVGAQRSSDRPSSDAAGNLIAAARVAATADLGEVVVLMHAASSDEDYVLIRGTRARKNHTSRRDAFDSMNIAPVGRVRGESIALAPHHRPPANGPPRLQASFETTCALVWSSPLIETRDLERPGVKGIVLAGTGLGHVPRRLLDAVANLTRSGVIVAMASQCLWGRVNLNVYSTGRDLLARGVVPARDMIPEVALVKLMWLLANAKDRADVERLLQVDLVGEISPVTPFQHDEEPGADDRA